MTALLKPESMNYAAKSKIHCVSGETGTTDRNVNDHTGGRRTTRSRYYACGSRSDRRLFLETISLGVTFPVNRVNFVFSSSSLTKDMRRSNSK
ncbi:hypothetical protein OPV22_019503 [Ensete ventricosum]|uniref:Uncharacterized protein n=1 Tax=Ensete ventricosum TaxID=4639 RepID=A0AAV8P8Y0_ENSVE|nr:hypothetical protein OPV22_019503 [Ensete ventricosum]